MVVGAFPVIKLGALLMKQLSKPIANFAKERAKKNYFFRTYICMPPAQFYNWCEVKTKMWIMNLGKPTTIPNLNEAMAIDLGANLLGETIVFSIAAGILFFEYSRQASKELQKERARQEEISTLNYTIQQMYFQVERQDTQIKELLQIVGRLEKSHTFLPKWDKNKPSSSPPPPPPPPPELILPPTPLVSDPTAVVAAARKANIQGHNVGNSGQKQNGDSKGNGEKNNVNQSEDVPKTHSFLYGALASLQGRVIPFNNLEMERGILRQAVSYLQQDIYRDRGY